MNSRRVVRAGNAPGPFFFTAMTRTGAMQERMDRTDLIQKSHTEAAKTEKTGLTKEEFDYAQDVIRKLEAYYDRRVVGQTRLRTSLIAALLAEGHILIESVPGLAKTTAAKAISDAVDGKFSRIQCTPDSSRQSSGRFSPILSYSTRSTVRVRRRSRRCSRRCRSGR